jgi:tetratricopeptide (TPR) repeat protein
LSGLNERLASAPAAADLFVKRARLYLHAQAYGPATADARKALELDSGHPDARLCLARIWSETDRLPEALEVLDRLIAEQSRHYSARLERARVLSKQGDHLAATDEYDRLINSYPTDLKPLPEHYVERAKACAASGNDQVDRALHGLEAGLQRLGPLVSLQSTALDIERNSGRTEAVLQRLETLIASSARKDPWLVQRGDCLFEAGDADAARTAYLEAICHFNALPRSRQAVPANRAHQQRLLAALQTVATHSE